jgi:hypothetical protein
MDSPTIEKILWSTLGGRKFFRGCFPSDKIPQPQGLVFPSALIINEDPSFKNGSHWVSIFIKDKSSVFYFDSFAKPPIPIIEQYLSKFKNVVKNHKCFQSILSQTCAHYCIYFIFYSCKGNKFDNIINSLTNHNSDVYVQRFVKCLFKM